MLRHLRLPGRPEWKLQPTQRDWTSRSGRSYQCRTANATAVPDSRSCTRTASGRPAPRPRVQGASSMLRPIVGRHASPLGTRRAFRAKGAFPSSVAVCTPRGIMQMGEFSYDRVAPAESKPWSRSTLGGTRCVGSEGPDLTRGTRRWPRSDQRERAPHGIAAVRDAARPVAGDCGPGSATLQIGEPIR